MLRKSLGIGLALLFISSAFAGDIKWNTNFEEAKLQASKEEKIILLNFTGSDWCGWCFKLRDEVFKLEAFKTYAQEELILVEVDFPKRKALDADVKKQNKLLAEKYGVQGFPTILVLNSKGEIVAKTGYKRGGSQNYVNHLKSLIAQYNTKSVPEKK
ncbi:thioredoxin family protein [bacterium]|nr:thioredoxin family protein [bacterium]